MAGRGGGFGRVGGGGCCCWGWGGGVAGGGRGTYCHAETDKQYVLDNGELPKSKLSSLYGLSNQRNS